MQTIFVCIFWCNWCAIFSTLSPFKWQVKKNYLVLYTTIVSKYGNLPLNNPILFLFHTGSQEKKKRKLNSNSDKEQKALEKAALKLKKQEEREQKKLEVQKEKALKKALSASNKNLKPEECIKVNILFWKTYIKHILK